MCVLSFLLLTNLGYCMLFFAHCISSPFPRSLPTTNCYKNDLGERKKKVILDSEFLCLSQCCCVNWVRRNGLCGLLCPSRVEQKPLHWDPERREAEKVSLCRSNVELSNISRKVGLAMPGLHKRRRFLLPRSFSLSPFSPGSFFFSSVSPSFPPPTAGASTRQRDSALPALLPESSFSVALNQHLHSLDKHVKGRGRKKGRTRERVTPSDEREPNKGDSCK